MYLNGLVIDKLFLVYLVIFELQIDYCIMYKGTVIVKQSNNQISLFCHCYSLLETQLNDNSAIQQTIMHAESQEDRAGEFARKFTVSVSV